MGPTFHTRKLGNVHKNLKLYHVFMHSFLCQNVPIFLLHIMRTRRIDTFWSDGIDTYWSGRVWHRKSQTKNQKYSQRLFELYQLFINTFLCQTVPKSTFHILPKLLSTWLTQFCVTTHPNLVISDLAYTNFTNPISRSNVNYKKLLKYVNTTKFFRTNVKYENVKNIPIPPPSLF